MTYILYIIPTIWLWLRGIRWLWTRQGDGITYKPGWGPWKFLPVYLTTYLAGTIAGYGVVSLSRAWYERSKLMRTLAGMEHPGEDEDCRALGCRPAHPFARFMTRLLDWAFPGSAHGRHTGPRLWGVEGVR